MNVEFLQVSPDSVARITRAARAAGVDRHLLLGWMIDFWHVEVARLHDCRPPDGDVVTIGEQVLGQELKHGLGDSAKPVLRALIEQGFFEPTDIDGTLRVRGMSRYLELQKRRLAARKNGKKGGIISSKQRLSASSASSSGSLNIGSSGSSTNGEPRYMKRKRYSKNITTIAPDKAGAPPAQEPSNFGDATWPEAVAKIAEAFRAARGAEFAVDGSQMRALKALSLKASHSLPEVLRRWAIALRHQGFPTVSDLRQLDTHWNAFAGAGAPTPAARGGRAGPVDYAKQGWDESGEIKIKDVAL